MAYANPEPFLRQTSSILYIAVDSLMPSRGKSVPGLDQFTATLDHEGIPAVWLTSRSRLQFDEPRRKLAHTHPFIAEDGCAVYLPEGYFHLRPESPSPAKRKTSTMRLGRFTCIPIADPLPAAAEALESLSEDLGVPVVTLRSLSSRELVQNTGLPQREAELARQRDFDELFFFAGSSDTEIARFLEAGRNRKLQFRQHGVLWSVAISASVQRCIRELSKLYDRALRYHALVVGIATTDLAPGLFPFCERTLLLSDRQSEGDSHSGDDTPRSRQVPLHSDDLWERVFDALTLKT
jgi:predicted mannosyl-3-phosphoglycerate phosphatase (HAD superfamily)